MTLEKQLAAVQVEQKAIIQQHVAMQGLLETLGSAVAALTAQMKGIQQQLESILEAINSLMNVRAIQQTKTITAHH